MSVREGYSVGLGDVRGDQKCVCVAEDRRVDQNKAKWRAECARVQCCPKKLCAWRRASLRAGQRAEAWRQAAPGTKRLQQAPQLTPRCGGSRLAAQRGAVAPPGGSHLAHLQESGGKGGVEGGLAAGVLLDKLQADGWGGMRGGGGGQVKGRRAGQGVSFAPSCAGRSWCTRLTRRVTAFCPRTLSVRKAAVPASTPEK